VTKELLKCSTSEGGVGLSTWTNTLTWQEGLCAYELKRPDQRQYKQK